MNKTGISRVSPAILLIAALIVLFMGTFDRDLWTPDEPREAAICLEMSRTGDYMIPHLAGQPFIEKPPLYYAVSAVFINTLGNYIGNTPALRLVTVLFGIGTLLVTFLLARRLFGPASATTAAALLASMTGFIVNFHWIRIESALCFFVIAAIWSFAEVYFAKKPWFCIPAGLFAAGAFLCKGPIGLILIAIPWCAMIVLWLIRQKNDTDHKSDYYIGFHLGGLLIFLLLSGAWIVYLKLKGGETLWNEWFWVNQVGRLTGDGAAKAHIRKGMPLYYVFQLFADTLPWLPLVIIWIGAFINNLIKRRSMPQNEIFLFIWGIGSIVLLSLSATKRGIYMAPVLPAFALMCIPILATAHHQKWFRGYFFVWGFLCAIILSICTFIPFASGHLPRKIPPEALVFLQTFGFRNILSGVALIISLYILLNFRKGDTDIGHIILVSALLYIGLFAVPAKAVDTIKSMRSDIQSFTERISPEVRPHVAGYRFNETMLGCFYYYSGWAVPQIVDDTRINRIISGTDAQYDSIIVNKDSVRPEAIQYINERVTSPYQILEEKYTGQDKNPRSVFWIKGLH
jgi:4-amino-4-deoxy-L-arabinose transferase-like glycosyltransferase